MQPLGLDEVRKYAANMEYEAARFYRKAAETTRDASVRELLITLAEAEAEHESLAAETRRDRSSRRTRARQEDETARRMFVLQYVQPGLAGLMDGSVSTLAPLFAAAFATHSTWETFLVGMAASVGAGISMGFAEALSDDGSLTGRGTPWLRGTRVRRDDHDRRHRPHPALSHSGFLDRDRRSPSRSCSSSLRSISWIRWRYMDTPFLSAAFQVMVGGALVFLAGILIGNS